MSNHKETQDAYQALLDCGATPEQMKVIKAESALAGAMDANGTSIVQSLEGGDEAVFELSSPADVACFIACMDIKGSDKAHGWLISAVSDIANSIEAESNERVTCATVSGLEHLSQCMRSLAVAVETLPEAEIYA